MLYIHLICLFILSFLILGCDDKKDSNIFMQTSSDLAYTTEKLDSNPLTLKEIPKEVNDYTALYNAYLTRQNKGKKSSIKEAKIIDKTFVRLRHTYKNDKDIMQILESFSCILPDCSATKIKDTYFYPDMNIQEAFFAIIADKKTETFTHFDIIKDYSYVLKDMQTTSIDLQAQYDKITPFQTLKFTWDTQSLEIALTPKEEICKPYIYTYRTIFIQDSNGVRVRPQEERLSVFSYPTRLVDFVAKSCACARFYRYIPELTQAEKRVAKNALAPDKKHCENLANERKALWDTYMQDSRVIGILQHEQSLYP
ncbi:hypothetical protein LS77_007770 [Helicobacter bilis]|uniref:Uncharacterized protein n=2 Tax=Helicobacter bilis TaxID=37372 RepID=A0A6D2C6D1_9HELI|nr:hypothetical protein [Helicobacter bilis]EMZ38358.1 hypothetical protein C826_01394 [Helicobacter bilis WiWa]TLE03918.1 hypothetical protein LS77_007770 [Helicobacter bilis]TLE04872.1 hypothetical protein LS76_007150 [Helicobacter bilis]